jgi:predicted dehydrogenase
VTTTAKVGVIGAGLMGTTHVRTRCRDVPAAQVVALSDVISESGQRLADEVGIGTVYTDALELIRRSGGRGGGDRLAGRHP